MQLMKLKRGIEISSADEKLFRYLYENKVAATDQIHRHIFPDYNRRSVQNRLAKLVKNRLIKGAFHYGLGHKALFSLADEGFKRFVMPLGNNVKKELGSKAPAHDVDLLEIRWMLSQSRKLKRYYPENLITGNGLVSFSVEDFLLGDIRPDAVVEIELQAKPFHLALEYEAARKYAHRYGDLFRRYYNTKSIPGVLYICKNEALLNYIRGIEKSVIGNETPKFYYSDFSKWSSNEARVFTNLRNSNITL